MTFSYTAVAGSSTPLQPVQTVEHGDDHRDRRPTRPGTLRRTRRPRSPPGCSPAARSASRCRWPASIRTATGWCCSPWSSPEAPLGDVADRRRRHPVVQGLRRARGRPDPVPGDRSRPGSTVTGEITVLVVAARRIRPAAGCAGHGGRGPAGRQHPDRPAVRGGRPRGSAGRAGHARRSPRRPACRWSWTTRA